MRNKVRKGGRGAAASGSITWMRPGGAGGVQSPLPPLPELPGGCTLQHQSPAEEIKPCANGQGWRFVPRWARVDFLHMAVQRHVSISSGCGEDFKRPAPWPEPPGGHKTPPMRTPWGAALGGELHPIPFPARSGAGRCLFCPAGRGGGDICSPAAIIQTGSLAPGSEKEVDRVK